MGRCEVCGRHLKTGRKYCFEHRNSSLSNAGINMGLASRGWRKRSYENEAKNILILAAVFVVMGLGLLFTPVGVQGKIVGVLALIIGLALGYFSFKLSDSIPKKLMKAEARVRHKREELRQEIEEELEEE